MEKIDTNQDVNNDDLIKLLIEFADGSNITV